MLTPSEVKDLYPTMNVDDVLGAVYCPEDGSYDPAGWCEGLTRAAKLNGAQVNIQMKCLFFHQDEYLLAQ